jgi:hypothetical protein
MATKSAEGLMGSAIYGYMQTIIFYGSVWPNIEFARKNFGECQPYGISTKYMKLFTG